MPMLMGSLDVLQSNNKTTIVDVSDVPISDSDLVSIYRWLDTMEFSRPKKIAVHRDFADGVMMGELVAHYIPKIVNTRNYVPTSNTQMKVANWTHINEKVFKRFRFQLSPSLIKSIADARPGMIERVLRPLRFILLRGPKAVAPPSSKLENVKSRFMDIERTYLKRNSTPTPASSASSSKPPSSAKSSSASPAFRFRSQSPIQKSKVIKDVNANLVMASRNRPTTSNIPKYASKVNKPSTAPFTHPHHHHHLTIASANKKKLQKSEGASLPKNVAPVDTRGNQAILKMPLTSKLPFSVSIISPSTQPETKDELPHINTTSPETLNSKPSKKRLLPPSSSWLPILDNEQNDDNKIHQPKSEKERERKDAVHVGEVESVDVEDDGSVDDEIYCSGYEGDVDGVSGSDYFEDCFEDEDDGGEEMQTSRGKSSKRKVKRVIKYEYREEYILNVMASYQLPNERELEAVRKNYMSPGNKDPNCRGYGFV